MGNLGEGGDLRPYPSQLPKWSLALAKVKAGTGSAKILCVGDSTTLGYGSQGSNVVANSYPKQLVDKFNTANINATWQSFMGPGGPLSSVDYAHQDSRLVVGTTGWSFNTYPIFVPGGYPGAATTADTETTFLPNVNVDTFRIWYITKSGNGTFYANINGGTNTNTSTSASDGLTSITITGTLGSNTLHLGWVSGGTIYIAGVEAFDSTKKWISVINAGIFAGSVSTWTSDSGDAFGLPQGISKLGQDLTIIDLGINDWQSGVDAGAGYTSTYQSIITQAKASGGDVAIMTPNPSSTAVVSVARQNTYIAAMLSLASSNGLPVIDVYNAFGGLYTTASSNGWVADTLHPNGTGYGVMATTIYNSIR